MEAKLKTVKSKTTYTSSLFYDAWKILAIRLGPLQASRFVTMIRQGFGDSVEERRKVWKGKTMKEIIREMQ